MKEETLESGHGILLSSTRTGLAQLHDDLSTITRSNDSVWTCRAAAPFNQSLDRTARFAHGLASEIQHQATVTSIMGTLILRSLLTGLMAVAVELLHGIFRVKFLNPRIGDKTARRLGVFSGSVLLLLLAWLVTPWLNPTSSTASALIAGTIWLLTLLALDVGVGKLVFRFRWSRILDDFNPFKGSLLLYGMVFAFLCPLLASLLRSQ